MALLSVQQIATTGLTPVYSAVNASDTITPTDDIFLHVKNSNASTCTVTLTDKGTTPANSAAANPTIAIPTTQERFIYIPASMVDPTTGLLTVGYSVTASVTAALLRM